MTNQDFSKLQDALGLSNKDLAAKLRVDISAISKWRLSRKIPPYIEEAMEKLLQNIEVKVPLDTLIGLGRQAEANGMSFEKFLTQGLRALAGIRPENVTPMPGLYDSSAQTEPVPGALVADEPPPVAQP